MNTLAERLKFARERKGDLWTQAHLAMVAGVSTGTVGNLESGARGAKKATASLFPIAKALGVRYEWLESGQEPMASEPMRELTVEEAAQVSGGAVTTFVAGTPRITTPEPISPEVEQRLMRLLAVVFQVPDASRVAAIKEATEVLLDHLPPPPTAARRVLGQQ